jgi:hypothetical protein
MQYRSLFMIPTLALLAACGSSKESTSVSTDNGGKPILEQQTTASARVYTNSQGQRTTELTSVNYHHFYMMLTDLPTPAIMREVSTRRFTEGAVPAGGTMDLQVLFQDGDRYTEQWQKRLDATSWSFLDKSNSVIHTTAPGQGTQRDAMQIVNLVDGEVLMTHTSRLAALHLPGTGEYRYSGFHATGAAIPMYLTKDLKPWGGILTYCNKKKTIGSLVIEVLDSRLMEKVQNFPPDVFYVVTRNGQEIRTPDLDLYPEEGQPYYQLPNDVEIELNFGKIREIENIRIRIVNDRLEPVQPEDNRIRLVPNPLIAE